MKVGVISRGHHGEQTAKEVKKYFDVVVHELPEKIPEILENVEIPEEILESEMIISYAGHPDINMELIKKAKGIVFITGKGGSRSQLKQLADNYNTELILADICCNSPVVEAEFFEHFGRPCFEVSIDGDVLKDVKVVRNAFCGASNFVAEKLKGVRIEEAPSKAGYFTQIYPCLASRGIEGKIHLAAKIHKSAIEKAIQKAKKG